MDELRLKGTMMIIQHAILHILDTNTGRLIASQAEMALDGAGVQDYIEQIVKKIYAGDVKKGTLTAPFLYLLSRSASCFLTSAIKRSILLPYSTELSRLKISSGTLYTVKV